MLRSLPLELLKFKNSLKEVAFYVFLALKALRFWRREPPVTTPDELARYADTRSKFVAQTTLFGYLKTRSGTLYRSLFEDEKFANSINIAKWEIYLICLCDFAIYAAARVGNTASASDDEFQGLARYLVMSVLAAEEIPAERPDGFDDVREAFEIRIKGVIWRDTDESDDFFADSRKALVKWAPIADELKDLDTEIVENSMFFKWKQVRGQFNELLVAEAVLEAWRAQQSDTLPDSVEHEMIPESSRTPQEL